MCDKCYGFISKDVCSNKYKINICTNDSPKKMCCKKCTNKNKIFIHKYLNNYLRDIWYPKNKYFLSFPNINKSKFVSDAIDNLCTINYIYLIIFVIEQYMIDNFNFKCNEIIKKIISYSDYDTQYYLKKQFFNQKNIVNIRDIKNLCMDAFPYQLDGNNRNPYYEYKLPIRYNVWPPKKLEVNNNYEYAQYYEIFNKIYCCRNTNFTYCQNYAKSGLRFCWGCHLNIK